MSHYTVQIEGTPETLTIHPRYRIIRKVGSGAYGTVCSAHDEQEDRYCAIKKVYKVFDKRLITKRCLREIKLLQHFNGHPRIIELFDMDIVDPKSFNELYLVFNCMEASLHDIIHSDQPLDIVHGQWFLYQLLSGLNYIHAADVIHRDLKPANILVNRDCDIKICDFGMARGYSVSENIGSMTEYVTTRWYRAPEIMISPHNYSKLIDVWSVGCIFAEIIGRKVLFKGQDYVDQLYKILEILGLPSDISFWDPCESVAAHIQQLCTIEGQPPPQQPIDFSTLFPHCPPDGIDILQQLLQLDPHLRIPVGEALSHPFVRPFALPEEEALVPDVCDFSFERCTNEADLRQMIIHEVSAFGSGQNDTTEAFEDKTKPVHPHFQRNNPVNPLPSAADNSIHQTDTMVMAGGLVGEPEDLENDENYAYLCALVNNTQSVSIDPERQFRSLAAGPARKELERALSITN
ncbi:Mitogen-activated protein kinase [Apophysomyces sp. BC1034]|nr:Mitogen-activated protein kinase [Apophysomyces sp. BC1015]KAG0182790.1 Mitogen-activated protein kinase [Apophysomyces sp. BC1021]KAG0190054.1 Mitogen-activated protein kinase [Apophysomyces sp. BC1034]